MQYTWNESLIAELRAELAARTAERDAILDELTRKRQDIALAVTALSKMGDAGKPVLRLLGFAPPLPFEEQPAPENADAPANLERGTTMRGGLEQVSAAQMLTAPEDESRVSPFSCGSQFGDWATANCERCKKGAANNDDKLVCDLEDALTTALFLDGTITAEQGRRIGLPGYGDLLPYCWMCPEVDWTDEWRAEVEARSADA